MKPTLLSVLIVVMAVGCVSKSKARLQAQNAYLMGQNQALMNIQQQQAAVNSVTVIGPVKNHSVAWDEDMTLASAIVKAEYLARGNPRIITLTRKGETSNINPLRLLEGLDDVPVEVGDVIELKK